MHELHTQVVAVLEKVKLTKRRRWQYCNWTIEFESWQRRNFAVHQSWPTSTTVGAQKSYGLVRGPPLNMYRKGRWGGWTESNTRTLLNNTTFVLLLFIKAAILCSLDLLLYSVCYPFRDQRDILAYVPLTKSLFKSAGITVSHFFSMLPSTMKYLYSVESVRMHFPAKQPCTNDTVCNAA